MVYSLTSSHWIFLQEFSSPAWNLCSYCLLQKQVSFDALEQAMNEVIRKNDALRMAVTDGCGVIFEPFTPRRFARVAFPDEAAFLSWARQRANEPSADRPGMWDAYLIDIGGRTGIFNIGQHIMCDAMNVVNLYRKITDELNGISTAENSYAAHLESHEKYLQSRQFGRDKAYWEGVLSGSVPLVFSAASIGECENLTVRLPSIRSFCTDHGLSGATVMYTLTGLLLMRLQGIDAVSMGIPILGRTTQEEMEALGLFMHDVPMILHGGEKSFVQLAQEVESSLFDLFRHQRYDLPRRTLFDVSVDYTEYPQAEAYDAHVVYNDWVSTAMEFHFLQRDHLELTIRAQKGLIRSLPAVAAALEKLLREVTIDPSRQIVKLPIADLPFFETSIEFPDVSLYSLVETRCTGRIIEGSREYSLDALLRDAEKIDAAVRGKKRVIGVLCERSYTELAAIYGVIRGGSAYLPISPDFPPERIRLMLEQSACDTVLVQRKFRDLIPGLIIEEILEGPSPISVPPAAALPEDTLYVIFTSGSTGTPKGAMVSNRSALNRILWMCRRYFDRNTVVMLKTPYTFDVSVWEIFGFALGGFTVYILPPEDHYRQDRVVEHIRLGGVTDLHFVPSVYRYFLDAWKKDGRGAPSLKSIFLSGEALNAHLVNASPAPVHNLYGPTECAVDVTTYDCAERENDPVPIGKPIDNCRMYVLDRQFQPLPPGIVGQICIGGVPVGQGYIRDPELTAQVFVDDPFGDGKLYLTGDLGYWREDGELIYCGRRDQQVKINGQRIELGEIEAALCDLVPAAAVVSEGNRLHAFYTGEVRTDLREQLKRILPRYMVPHSFTRVDKIPLTSSGKTDRRALLSLLSRERVSFAAPATQEEQLLVEAIRESLSLSNVSAMDNFYGLGGDSLSALIVVALLESRGWDLSVPDFLKSDTLADAAKKLRKASPPPKSGSAGPCPPPPMIRTYLYEKPDDASSFVQSCTVPTDAAEADVRRALDELVTQHDMLRAVFSDDGSFSIGDAAYSFKTAPGPDTVDPVFFDLRHGPLVDAVLYPGALKLTIHHFAADAVSWALIVSDLNAALRHEPMPARSGTYSEWVRLQRKCHSSIWSIDMLPLLHSEDPVNPEERFCFTVKAVSNDVLLTALSLSANSLVKGKAGICVETHGRVDPRFNRTVGWFTAAFPFVTESLQETKDTLARVPDLGVGYLQSYGHLPENASILYNYVPVTDSCMLGPLPLFPGKINVNCLVRADRLDIEIGVPRGRHVLGITKKLGVILQRYLDAQPDADGREDILGNVFPSDTFDLTPTQLGIYRHWDAYRLRYTVELESQPDAERLEKACIMLARRHPMLRARFIKLRDGSVKQCMPVTPHSIVSSVHAGQEPLFRVALEDGCLTVFTHHIILDGWSLSVLARDLQRFYQDPSAEVLPTPSFSLYVRWLQQQPDGLPYWKKLLSGCGLSSDLPHTSRAAGQPHAFIERTFPTDGLAEFAKRRHVSVSTVLETALSGLLLSYGPTAIFGKMVSGRNAPIPGIRDMVGPFVNMIPVYVNNTDNLLSQLHEQSIQANEFGTVPFSELYSHTDLRRINILFIFENYPAVTGIRLVDYAEENEFDLTITVRETPAGYAIRASYAPDKYQMSVIDDALNGFEYSLRQLLSDKVYTAPSRVLPTTVREFPTDETELTIAGLFERILNTGRVSRFDSFYDLGGTSLDMMELLCEAPLSALSPSLFMRDPTPAGLAKLLTGQSPEPLPVPLYVPEAPVSAYVLFPYGGGDAAAYTALVAEFRKRNAPVALYFIPWGCNYDAAAEVLRSFSLPLRFYSHCAGAVIALKLLDRLDCVEKYIVGANLPPEKLENPWPHVDDGTILSVLREAGMPGLPEAQESVMLRGFRENAGEYFDYLRAKRRKTPIGVSLILSRSDLFTRSFPDAVRLWERWVERVDDIRLFDWQTHYFQSSHAAALAEILLKEE